MPELIAYCGLDCDACNAFIATRDNNEALRATTATEWSKMFDHEFKPEEIHCTGCAGDGRHVVFCDTMCAVRKCAQERKVTSCGACAEYGCATLTAHLPHMPPEAKARLESIRNRRK
jgi:hypothetical protein